MAATRYELDTIAVCVMAARRDPLFRFTAVMAEAVDQSVLARAVADVLPRFPFFTVRMRRGLFLPYFEQIEPCCDVIDDGGVAFSSLGRQADFFRFSHHERRISLEVHHALTDGYGALVFLKSVLARYLAIRGVDVAQPLELDAAPDPSEYRDDVPKCCDAAPRRSPKETPAFHVAGDRDSRVVTTVGLANAAEVVERARSHHTTVTEYLAGALVQALHERQLAESPRKLLPVAVSVSADLRRLRPSPTLRNYAYFANLGTRPRRPPAPLEGTLADIRGQSREAFSPENLTGRMAAQMRYYRLLRPLPIIAKRLVFELVYLLTGERNFSAVFTNMGVVELPPGAAGHVERVETSANVSASTGIKCGAISCNGVLAITFTNGLGHTSVEERFFELLRSDGLAVHVELGSGSIEMLPLAPPTARPLDEDIAGKETA